VSLHWARVYKKKERPAFCDQTLMALRTDAACGKH
jgi:hypothetical protein